jgi:hypothetical protein
MSKLTMVGAQMDKEKLDSLKAHAKESGKKLYAVLNEAADLYLKAQQIRPKFREAMNESLAKNKELYKRLAK